MAKHVVLKPMVYEVEGTTFQIERMTYSLWAIRDHSQKVLTTSMTIMSEGDAMTQNHKFLFTTLKEARDIVELYMANHPATELPTDPYLTKDVWTPMEKQAELGSDYEKSVPKSASALIIEKLLKEEDVHKQMMAGEKAKGLWSMNENGKLVFTNKP